MKHVWTIFMLFCLTNVIFFTNTLHQKQHETETLLNSKNKSLEASYKAVTQMYRVSIENYFKYAIMQPSVIEILREAQNADEEKKALLRGKLYRLLYPLYQNELKKKGLKLLHFHTNKGESFLRFHQPNENGDSLFDIRPTLKIAATTHTFVSGFEGGRVYPGFRYVYPIMDGKTFLGTVELSLSYESIVKELSKLLSCKYYLLLLKKDVITDVVFTQYQTHFVPSPLSDLYTIENPNISALSAQALHSSLIVHLNALIKKENNVEILLAKGQNFSLPIIYDHEGYSINFYPIYMLDHTLAAYATTYATTYDTLPELITVSTKYTYIYCFGFLAISCLYLGLYLLLVQRKRLLVEKMQFETIVTNSVNGIMLLHNDGSIKFINQAGLTLLKYQAKEVVGKNAHQLIHVHNTTDQNWKCPILESMQLGKSYVGEETFSQKSGEHLIVHINLTPFIQNNKAVGSVLIFRDITDEKKSKETIEHLAYYDSLTELPNRKLLLDHLTYAIATTKRTHEYCGLFYIDLDNFKTLNDTKGHEYGDMLLQHVASRLNKTLRLCDTISRFGGDEFVVLVTALGNDGENAHAKLTHIGYKLHAIFVEPFSLHDYDYLCTASIGGTLFVDESKTVNDILKDADAAMYEVKKSTKNEVKII